MPKKTTPTHNKSNRHENTQEPLISSNLLSPRAAAELKGVTTAAIYLAIKEERLPHIRVLGRIGLNAADVKAWTPISYAGRPGVKGRRPAGIPMSEEAKARLSDSLKRRWAERKQVERTQAVENYREPINKKKQNDKGQPGKRRINKPE